ncbi:MAG: retropepsin-like aspartic protease, partial [Chloroflexota bacterium]
RAAAGEGDCVKGEAGRGGAARFLVAARLRLATLWLLLALLPVALLGCEAVDPNWLDELDERLKQIDIEALRPGAPPPKVQLNGRVTIPLDVQTGFDGSVLVLVPVYIDGQGPYEFALDTGASRSLVDEDLADELNLRTVGRAQPVLGVFGAGEARLVAVDDWRLGEVDLPASRAVTLDLPGPSRGQGLRGLLGSDMLATFGAVTIDYEAEVLILGQD